MALSLDPTLATRMDSQFRRPLVEIISSNFAADIPFDGNFLSAETTSETNTNNIVHSSGRICGVYNFGGESIKYFYTDLERTTFSFVTFAQSSLVDVALCELSDGNIGIITRDGSSTVTFRYRIITPTGVAVSNGDITSYSGSPEITGPAVIRKADDSYLMIYIRNVSGDYTFYKMTSSNFTSWSSASSLSITGLTAANETAAPYLHPDIGTSDLFLFFDYENIENTSNIYYSVSSDGGATWGAAVQVTSYTSAAVRAKHPIAAQKIAGQFFLFFNEQRSALTMNSASDEGWGTAESHATDLTFDPVSRKLYVSSSAYTHSWAIIEIDVDTWTVTRMWDQESTPAFPQGINQGDHSAQGDGQMIPLFSSDASYHYVSLLNAADNVITTYCFEDVPVYGLTQNVENSLSGGQILGVKVDMTARRLYIFRSYPGGADTTWYRIGYIDLTEPGPIYHYTEIVAPSLLQTTGIVGWSGGFGFDIFPAQDFILVWLECALTDGSHCAIVIHNLSTGAFYKRYQWTETFVSFPWHGVKSAHLVGNKIYATFTYHATYGQGDKRGLCEIDILTDSVRYLRPTWETVDEYGLGDIHSIPDGRLIITAHGYGITIFNPTDETWILYNNTNLPGMDPGTGWDIYNFVSLAYDEENGIVFMGWGHNVYGDWEGVGAFSIYGFIKQAVYKIATYSAGWTFGATADAVTGFQDYDLTAVFGPGVTDGLFVFWTNLHGSEYSIEWDKEGMTLNLGAYLARGREISIRRSIDGSPNELKFTVSHGHLFDPDNFNSLLSPILEKGRKITVRIGENISGTEYWANQGTFTVNAVRLNYERGQYPEMEVSALDRRLTWDHGQVLATEYYDSADPEDVLSDILTGLLNFTEGELDIPVFANSAPISHQWMECLPKDIISQICNRFGYYPRITVDNKFSCRKISNANPVDHTYSDKTKLVRYTPDDSFSDFTNQIIVVGHELTEIEIVYEEERIETISGTIGWWSREKDYTIYYSKDMSRRCRNPRLVVIESSSSAPFELAGRVSESITYVDPNEYYCIVTVEGPDLLPMLVSALLIIVGAYLLGDMVVSLGYGWTVPVGRYIQMVGVIMALNILASICNFQLEVWARPLGKVRRSLQGTWNDAVLQGKIQQIITQKIEEPLCNSVPQCTEMANQEGMEVQLQRKRRQFSKIADLRDEEGDTLQILHPHTNLPLKIFVTELTRRMMIPGEEEKEGYFIDDIEGWRI